MAPYQLGFYGFSQLQVASATRAARLPLSGQSTPSVLGPGASFRTASALSAVTTVRIEEASATAGGDVTARVAAESPYGVPGARVDLMGRIVTQTDEPAPREVVFHILALGGDPQGLVGTSPLVAGVTYHIQQSTAADPGLSLRDFGEAPEDGLAVDPFAGAMALSLTHGTLIDTPEGPRPVEALAPGDLVTTLANGSQPVRWVGHCSLPHEVLRDRPHLRPIRIEAGTLGNQRALLVAPQQRMLIGDWRAQVYFGEDQVLISAGSLDNGQTIRQVLPEAGLAYCHLLFDRHEVILAEGALAESFHPGEEGLGLIDPGQRREIERLFPHNPVGRRRAAFPIMKRAEARTLRLPI